MLIPIIWIRKKKNTLLSRAKNNIVYSCTYVLVKFLDKLLTYRAPVLIHSWRLHINDKCFTYKCISYHMRSITKFIVSLWRGNKYASSALFSTNSIELNWIFIHWSFLEMVKFKLFFRSFSFNIGSVIFNEYHVKSFKLIFVVSFLFLFSLSSIPKTESKTI